MGPELLLLVPLVVLLSLVAVGGYRMVSEYREELREKRPKVCEGCHVRPAKHRYSQKWATAHQKLHEGSAAECMPCRACGHSCLTHQQLVTSHISRFVCMQRRCQCPSYQGLIVKG